MTDRRDLHEALQAALRAFVVEMEHYVTVASAAATLHRTDLTALSHAMDATHTGSRLSPGELAIRMGLSPSATTSMLDRLEAAGHVVRSRDNADRRQVTVSLTEHAAQTGYRLFAPLAEAFEDVMTGYSDTELARIQTFLEQVVKATQDARPTSSTG